MSGTCITLEGIRTVLKSGDKIAIEKAKAKMLAIMSQNADIYMAKGASLSGLIASTFKSNELSMDKDKPDIALQFRRELLLSFMELHNMSIYHDPANIKNGDSIIVKKNKVHLAYDVIESVRPNMLLRLCPFPDGKPPTDPETIKITKNNFMFGIGLKSVGPITNRKLFFFFCNNI